MRRKNFTHRAIEAWRNFSEAQQLRMAHYDALPQLALMSIACGVLAGAVIILFRWVVEISASSFFPMENSEGFESLSPLFRFSIAVLGGLAVGLMFHFAHSSMRQVGVVHVVTRLNSHQGYLPLGNAVMQFIGAALSIICGHSVGREGPNIHLGAASGSLLGRKLGLPNNSVRTLVGCGVAAAIAAGFNTPLAGVIFAMEVVLMEYTIVGFVPIILAAVSATALTRVVHGEDVVFFVYTYQWSTLHELLYVLILGVAIGALAAAFIRLTLRVFRVARHLPIWLKMLIAGVVIGIIALPAPEVMGIGYDTVRTALLGEIALATLLLIVLGKLLGTSVCIGLGSPGGLIGPTLFMGATAGGALGWLSIALYGADVSAGFYAMLGMGAMMAATLQAPLAALVALMELTANPKVIMPGMTAVVSAVLVTRVVFRCPSIYQLIMEEHGLSYGDAPVAQTMRRTGVASIMNRNFSAQPRTIEQSAARALLAQNKEWILVQDQKQAIALLPIPDLARYIKTEQDALNIDLMAIPATRLDLIEANVVATVQDALELLARSGKQALYITGRKGGRAQKVYGVLTRTDIERNYGQVGL